MSKQNKLTKEQVEELYGEVPLLFDSYYKYSFTYVGEADDGIEIVMSYGGQSDDVYRYTVGRDTPQFLIDGYTSLTVRDGDIVLFEEDNYY